MYQNKFVCWLTEILWLSRLFTRILSTRTICFIRFAFQMNNSPTCVFHEALNYEYYHLKCCYSELFWVFLPAEVITIMKQSTNKNVWIQYYPQIVNSLYSSKENSLTSAGPTCSFHQRIQKSTHMDVLLYTFLNANCMKFCQSVTLWFVIAFSHTKARIFFV